jgi:pimeloyl-ACP methyl ester carboxylesterase
MIMATADLSPGPSLPHDEGLVDVGGGIRLAVRHAEPTRPGLAPALYVHGLGGSGSNWTALALELRDTVDGVALDLPGFGLSPPAPGGYSVAAHANAVARLIRARGQGPVHLFGNSLGGAVSTRLAALRPDLVRTLTLVSPALPDLRPRRSALPVALVAAPGAARYVSRAQARHTAESQVRALYELCLGDPRQVPPERFLADVAETAEWRANPHLLEALVRSARQLLLHEYPRRGRGGLWRLASQVQAPTLLVYGGLDKLVDPRMSARAMRTFPDARLLMLPDSGHVAMLEHPGRVARAFRELLAEQAARAEPGGGPAGEGGGFGGGE